MNLNEKHKFKLMSHAKDKKTVFHSISFGLRNAFKYIKEYGDLKLCNRKRIIICISVVLILVGGFYVISYVGSHKKAIAISSLNVIGKVTKFLPIPNDTKNELAVVNTIVSEFTKKDDVEKTFLIMLQNDAELRPGGGFLGQYAIIKIKNGDVISTFVEDANLLDQRIQTKVPTPFPFERMMQLKRWKFRDSNFSPDFPTNVEKAKYFYRLSGKNSQGIDGVIAVNSQVFDDLFALTGPISVPGYGGEFTSENASRKLEEIVEKQYLLNSDLDTQNRKAIMKTLAPMMINKLLTVGNINGIADLFHREMQNKNVMLNFSNQNLQQAVESVHWDGKVAQNWGGDYLMMVDANMGALKSDHYMKREINYDLDFTGEHPVVTLNILYKHTAPYGDWRTSDYHSYLRIYVPRGSTLVENKMVNNIAKSEDFNKSYFGFKLDVLIGRETNAMIKYQLPDAITPENYKLLIQKQSGVGNVPVTVHLKTKDNEFNQQQTLTKDLQFEFNKV